MEASCLQSRPGLGGSRCRLEPPALAVISDAGQDQFAWVKKYLRPKFDDGTVAENLTKADFDELNSMPGVNQVFWNQAYLGWGMLAFVVQQSASAGEPESPAAQRDIDAAYAVEKSMQEREGRLEDPCPAWHSRV